MIRLRSAERSDVAEVAALHRLSMRTAMPWLPELHTPEDDLRFFADKVFPCQSVTLATIDNRLAGFSAAADGWLHHLYVDPAHQGRGVGWILLNHVRRDTTTLQLWAFQRNYRARRFYERAGFRVARLTDGSGNEEGEPDVLYVWNLYMAS
jgi:GNAT superfamily N-acetyltransferase